MPCNQRYEEPPEYLDKIGKKIVDAAYQVHVKWGPGLLEQFYHIALFNELIRNGLNVQSEVYLPIVLDGQVVPDSYRLDLLVDDEVIVEIKAVEKLTPLHFQQIRTYLKVGNKRLGYLINFNTALIMDGINREIMSSN